MECPDKIKSICITTQLTPFSEFINPQTSIFDHNQLIEELRLDYIELQTKVKSLKENYDRDLVDEYYLESSCDTKKTIERLSEDIHRFISHETKTTGEVYTDKCLICLDISTSCISLTCKHSACISCFIRYTANAILNGEIGLTPKCFYPNCNVPVHIWLLSMLHKNSSQTMGLYYRSLLGLFLTGHQSRYFICKIDTCQKIIYKPQTSIHQQAIICKCLISYCSLCFNESHFFINCHDFSQWKKNKTAKLDTANNMWLSDNTKSCPSCQWAIEKNNGCLHMRCLKCKFEFCWDCLTPWNLHRGTSLYICKDKNQVAENLRKKPSKTDKKQKDGFGMNIGKGIDVEKLNVVMRFESIYRGLVIKLQMMNNRGGRCFGSMAMGNWMVTSIVVGCELIKGVLIKQILLYKNVEIDLHYVLLENQLLKINVMFDELTSEGFSDNADDGAETSRVKVIVAKISRTTSLINVLLSKYS